LALNTVLNKFNRNDLAYLAVSLLLSGLLFNRVVQNVGLFFACIYIVSYKGWYKVFIKDKYIVSFGCLALITLVFDVLHSPDQIFQSSFFLKMSLLVYPLFIKIWDPKKEIITLFYTLMIIVFINIAYGFFHFITDMESILEGYKRAKVIPTLALGDHIRMSWLSVIGVWGALSILKNEVNPFLKYVTYFFVFVSIVYLHVLSAKTGLFLLYSSFFIYGVYTFVAKDYLKSFIIYTFLFILPFLAYKTLPSLQNRVAYIVWDVTQHLNGNRQKGLSDGSRIASIKAGWDIGKNNWFIGTGLIDLKTQTYDWYRQNEPKMLESDYIMPSSQFIILFASCGILGLFIFIIHLWIPLSNSHLWKDGIFISLYIPSIATFLYETHLEGQYAIFVYSFFIYLFYYLSEEKAKD
jgi:O-antigen ligase